MSADLLRRAATNLRERAETEAALRAGDLYYVPGGEANSWDRTVTPSVGFAVAAWLDATAEAREVAKALGMGEPDRAVAVARAVLGDG